MAAKRKRDLIGALASGQTSLGFNASDPDDPPSNGSVELGSLSSPLGNKKTPSPASPASPGGSLKDYILRHAGVLRATSGDIGNASSSDCGDTGASLRQLAIAEESDTTLDLSTGRRSSSPTRREKRGAVYGGKPLNSPTTTLTMRCNDMSLRSPKDADAVTSSTTARQTRKSAAEPIDEEMRSPSNTPPPPPRGKPEQPSSTRQGLKRGSLVENAAADRLVNNRWLCLAISHGP